MPAVSRKWIITGTVMTGTIMSALDSSIVNVALPYMRGNLGATIEEIAWVATGYILANVIIMPIVGLLAARIGRKRLYLASVFAFTAASALCGTARSLEVLVVWRIIQGIGGGAIVPISQAILRETFPLEEQGVAMGMYGLGVVLAPAIGPTLGGWLTDNYSWPWIFYINVPIGVLNLALVTRFIEDPPYLVRERGALDWSGLAFMTVGLGALQLMLEKGQDLDWFSSRLILWLLVISAAALVVFVWRELRTERPAVDLRILRNVPFTSGTVLGGVLGMGLYGSLFLLPLFLQQLLGYPAFDSGLALMPRSLAMAVVMPLGGLVYNRLGPRWIVGSGLAVSAFSFWELSRLSADSGFWDIFLPQVWQGVGFALIFVALSTAALSTIERPKMTAATGLYNVVRQVFGSVGIAIAATQLTAGETRYHAVLAAAVNPYRDVALQRFQAAAGALGGGSSDPVLAAARALKLLDLEVARQAGVLAYNHVFELVTILFVISVPLVLFLRSGAPGAKVEVVAE